MTLEQALDNLYKATTAAAFNLETHQALRQCYDLLKKHLEAPKAE